MQTATDAAARSPGVAYWLEGRTRAAGAIVLFLLSFASISSFAQGPAPEPSSIAIDGRLPGTFEESLAGPDYQIPASKGALSGSNLFFSFSRFGLDTGESATFTGPDSVRRIVSRVTGGNASSINGLIRSEISGADLYLINPNGIVFGEQAALDLDGAFHATTADYLEFEDGAEFHASSPQLDSPLSMVPVAAFGFMSADPAPITIEGSQLITGSIDVGLVSPSIAEGEDFSLTGGDITIRGGPDRLGYIFTGGSRLDIASLDSPGRVRIVNKDPTLPGSSNDLVVEPTAGVPLVLGDVRIADGVAIVTGGPPPIARFVNTFTRDAGDVFVRAHDLTLEDAEVRTITTTGLPGGRIDIDLTGDFVADGLGLNRTTGLVAGSGLTIRLREQTAEDPGERFFPDPRFSSGVENWLFYVGQNAIGPVSRYELRTTSRGGDILVSAENVSLLNGAKLSSSAFFGGDAGSITVNARDTVTLSGTRQDGVVGGIFSNALLGGDSGSISVKAQELLLDDLAGIFGEVRDGDGAGGSIDIDVDRLEISGSGRIDTTTRGSGPGGEISIDASEWLRLDGRQDDFNFSSITTFSLEEGTGPAGTIRIRSPQVQLRRGAGISTEALGEGDGGVIDLRADVIDLDASSISSAAELGTAGDIYINAGPLEPGSLRVQKPAGVVAGQRLFLNESIISTSANDGMGRGGNIVIDPEYVVLRESQILARAVRGQGGNIVIVADQLISDLDSMINADSEFSTNGIVELKTSAQELRGDISSLPSTIPAVVELLREQCAARRSGAAAASFVLRERDGLPFSPDDYLPAYHALEEIDSESVVIVPVSDPDGPAELILGCRVGAS
jgi:filamentous hemagglutinin family protein